MPQPPRPFPVRGWTLLVLFLLTLLAACGDRERDYEITHVQDAAQEANGAGHADPHAGLFTGAGHPPVDPALMDRALRDPGITWTAPHGWKADQTHRMRLVTFHASPQAKAECYVTILGPGAGSVVANMNRWREQMGQGPLDTAEFARLKRIPVLGQDTAVLEVEGTYRGAEGEHIEGALLLGIACTGRKQTLFVKMIGPRDEVRAQRANFEALCSSLRRTN